MTPSTRKFTALILAGSRSTHDPVAQASGVSCKALTLVGNQPMVLRVLNTLEKAETISTRVLSGPLWSSVQEEPRLQSLIDSQQIHWVEPQVTPSASAYAAMQTLSKDSPILLTTADHALLTPEMVDYFCSKASSIECDAIVELVDYQLVQQAYPKSKRTVTRFKDKGYCGCNLFGFLTPRGREAAQFWQQVEQERKQPFRLIRRLGVVSVLRYLTGYLTLSQALSKLSKQLGLRIEAILLPFPQAAVDVDTVEDWELTQKILKDSSGH